jgi:hypothetical protein
LSLGKEKIVSTAFRPALGPTQPPIQWILQVKQLGYEADHSLPTGAEVKKTWIYMYPFLYKSSWFKTP